MGDRMDHDQASALLSDLVAGRLAPAEAGDVEAHLGRCDECRSVYRTLWLVREEASATGDALFDAHPEPELLVRYALADAALATAELARVGAHARACPTCFQEVAVTRRAEAGPGFLTRFARLLFPHMGSESFWPRLAPVLTALVLVLSYPAYLGVVRAPEAGRRNHELVSQLGATQERERTGQNALQATRDELSRVRSWGGGVNLLYLEGATRSGGASRPSISVRPEQPLQPILIDHDLSAAAGTISVSLVREGSGGGAAPAAPLWEHTGTRDELWDRASHGISLLVPAALLTPGEYRVEIRQAGGGLPRFSARFRVTPAGNSP